MILLDAFFDARDERSIDDLLIALSAVRGACKSDS